MTDMDRDTHISMSADCTIRGIEHARATLLQAAAGEAVVIACDAVEQADITFVQLIVSAQTTLAASGRTLCLTTVPACVQSVFERAAVALPCSSPQG